MSIMCHVTSLKLWGRLCRYLFPDKYDGNESATYEDDSRLDCGETQSIDSQKELGVDSQWYKQP